MGERPRSAAGVRRRLRRTGRTVPGLRGQAGHSTERITPVVTEQRVGPIDRKQLRSQRLREVNFQGDALRLGMNWTEDDLQKPQRSRARRAALVAVVGPSS